MTNMACLSSIAIQICPCNAVQSVTNAAIESRLLYNSGRPKTLELRYQSVACAI